MQSKPIRILHVVSSMDYAGIETLIMEIYRNINRDLVQFDFLIHNSDVNDYQEEIEYLGGKIFRIEKYELHKLPSYEKKLESFFKDHPEYEIVHSHINTFSKYVLKAAKKFKVKYRIAHSHTSTPSLSIKTFLKRLTKFKLNSFANYKFACSEKAAKWLFNSAEEVIFF